MPNLFIESLTAHDHQLVKKVLTPLPLTQRSVLFNMGDVIADVYFPETAIISLVVPLSSGDLVEAAMVGRDGMVGAASALNGKGS